MKNLYLITLLSLFMVNANGSWDSTITSTATTTGDITSDDANDVYDAA